MKTNHVLVNIEERFKKVTGYGDLSKFPLWVSSGYMTDREKSREFAEVFTPPHIVDEMLLVVPGMKSSTRNVDLCAGSGQFTIRILRKLSQDHEGFDIPKYLRERHYFSELQVSSCYKLLWIFGCGINLAIGDVLQLGKLPVGWRGVWIYVEGLGQWVEVTGFVRSLRSDIEGVSNPDGWIRSKMCSLFPYNEDDEVEFVRVFESFVGWLNRHSKEYKMDIKHIAATKAGRQLLAKVVRESATGVEVNWQDVATPEWVVKEMVASVPDVKSLSRILVLFNIEFVEQLVKLSGVRASRIDFGSDSVIEEEFAKSVYGVKAFSIGKGLESMKASLNGRAEKYDVVFSNPPYQVMDGGFKASARPVYHEIVMYTIDVLKPQYVCMITPSRWMAGGKGLDDYRARMMKDTHFRLIEHYAGTSTVFPEVSISGGVSYFLWDRDYNGPCIFDGESRKLDEFDVIVTNSKAITILRKVLKTHTGTFLNASVSSRKPYGFDEDTEASETGIACWFKQSRGKLFVDPCIIKDTRGDLCKWKVLSPRTIPGADVMKFGVAPIEAIHSTNMFVAKPGEGCSESYIVLRSFKTQAMADNFRQYVLTKFFRFMLLLRVVSQDVTREKFSWVPDLGDYSNPIIDEDLYAHFGLTKKEIEHIESTIKAI